MVRSIRCVFESAVIYKFRAVFICLGHVIYFCLLTGYQQDKERYQCKNNREI